ncbi:MAG: polysaccharide biosynthesis C-terminal domain-containing protein [Acetanaerobacterium sp.]
MNQYKKLISNTLIFAIGTFSSKILVFLLMPLYTRILSPADYSVVELVTGTANFMIPIIAVCIGEAIIRFGLDGAVRKDDVFTSGILTVLIGFAVFAVFFPLFSHIPFITGYTPLVYLYVLASSLKGVCAQFVRAKGYVRLYAFDGILSTVMVLTFNILGLVVFKLGITGYVLAIILSDLLSALFLMWVAGLWRYFKFRRVNRSVWKAMMRYSIPLIPNTLFFWVTNLSDRYIITALISPEINGLYSIAYKIPTIITAVSTIFMQAWQLSAFSQADVRTKSRFYSTVFDGYQSVLFIIGSGVILLIQPLTKLLVAPEYYGSWVYVPLLILSVVFACFATFFASVYMSEKKNMMTMITTFTGAVANVVLNFALIPKFGANGAAFATFASYFVVFLFRAVHTRRYIPVQIAWGRLVLNLLLLSAQVVLMIVQPSFLLAAEIVLVLAIVLINLQTLITALLHIFEQRRAQ